MRFDFLKDRKELVSRVLVCGSVVLGVVIVIRIGGVIISTAEASRLVREATAQGEVDPNSTEKYFEKSRKIAEELKKKNMFSPPAPEKHPVSSVSGLLGDGAIINGKLYKVGDKIGDAKVVAIGATFVKIEWDGKEKTFSPFDVGVSAGPSASREAKKEMRKSKRAGKKLERVEVEGESIDVGRRRGRRGRGKRFRELSEEEREKLRARMRARRESRQREND